MSPKVPFCTLEWGLGGKEQGVSFASWAYSGETPLRASDISFSETRAEVLGGVSLPASS